MASDTPVNTTAKIDLISLPSEQSHELLMAVIGILSFFCVLGTVGNFLVLYVYVRKRNKVASTVFIITLACTDFLTCVLIIPYTIVLEYMDYFIKYDFLCKCYMFLITSNVPFSAFIMMAIAVDRYFCICYPFTHFLTTRRAKLIITILASFAFVLGIITALNFGVNFRMSKLYTNETSLLAHQIRQEVSKQEHIDGIMFVPKSNWTYSEIVYPLNRTKISASDNITVSVLMYDGICKPNGLIFNHSFTETYQKIYSSFFVIVIVVVAIVYIMIYRFVSLRRALRRRMRYQHSGYSSCKDHAASYLNTRASITNGCVNTELETYSELEERPKSENTEINRQMTIREKGLVANIRTAGMLFVVTAVFIIAFLPAWLMAHQVIPYNILIFYMYFFYNVANPIIYAFMNKTFRRDLKDVVECRLT
ncbi:cholecystokinin receptor type A-like [Mya arenaria]|uniref:cholecystokinin receptor type A-like n=1 Tax=Mya arenaria TaxID=6604 RepID=UPI0022E3845B|nr:cholecystokinin receptor type A-like [Mya arenaria]XP_052761131.1 cholecystokinin receptor type A-like [Mya arenaria]XP_052761132.1 cholecystokinin receptor type A-like [Mya arenaria]